MKVYCEECNGSGKLVELLRCSVVCDKCDGKGYTEITLENMPESAKQILKECDDRHKETLRLAEIGRATELALNKYNQSYFAIGKDYGLDTEEGGIIRTVEELLEWAKEQTK